MLPWDSYARAVVKVGSALLVDPTGRLAHTWLDSVAADIAELRGEGREIVVVSSGAIALGRKQLGFARPARRLHEQQAAAAVGQIRLADGWNGAFARHGLVTAQILLTADDTEHRRRYLNAEDTITTLLERKAVPVVNENDTVATDEIRYGDNDRLAARVAQMISADVLIVLSDIDGVYSHPPGDKRGEHIAEIHTIDARIEAMAGTPNSEHGSGGMAAKIAAARIAVAAGSDMLVADGRGEHPLAALRKGKRCTRFVSPGTPHLARKRWIAGALKTRGHLCLDRGAVKALASGASLLPVGVTDIGGDFRRGDPVILTDPDGAEIARGLSAYDCEDARRIIGRNSADIPAILGFGGRGVIVHRDDLAWTASVERTKRQ